jgi:RNA exonuclease 4
MPPSQPATTSNWKALKMKLQPKAPQAPDTKKKRCRDDQSSLSEDTKKRRTDINEELSKLRNKEKTEKRFSRVDKEKYVGLDCEMVGIGPEGKISVLARCCIVNFDGEVIYDQFVRPSGFVTDFRTKWSGVRKKNLREGHAISFKECQEQVAGLIKGKILVGHALKNDLDVLMLNHHRNSIRDTARYAPYMRTAGKKGGKLKPRALKDLAKQFLGVIIQTSEHDPVKIGRILIYIDLDLINCKTTTRVKMLALPWSSTKEFKKIGRKAYLRSQHYHTHHKRKLLWTRCASATASCGENAMKH